jgi:F-type H+/Na+-transporting ATPase subunit alpha
MSFVFMLLLDKKNHLFHHLFNLFNQHQAMDYTIVVNAGASKEGTLLYLAPFAGVTMGEYFMEQGKDVLIVYDDLSKHAVAYREVIFTIKKTSRT